MGNEEINNFYSNPYLEFEEKEPKNEKEVIMNEITKIFTSKVNMELENEYDVYNYLVRKMG